MDECLTYYFICWNSIRDRIPSRIATYIGYTHTHTCFRLRPKLRCKNPRQQQDPKYALLHSLPLKLVTSGELLEG